MKECSKCTVQREALKVGHFLFPLWWESFVYCSVACCGDTARKLGSGDKHLGYALNKLFWFALPIPFTSQTLLVCLGSFSFSSFSFFGCAEMWKVLAGGYSLGGPIAFQAWGWAWCGLVVAGVFIYCSFFLCLGGWMAWSLWSACDDSGLQMRSRVCGAQGNTPCVGNSTQRRDCNEIPGELSDAYCNREASFNILIRAQCWPLKSSLRASFLFLWFWGSSLYFILCPQMSPNTLLFTYSIMALACLCHKNSMMLFYGKL